MSTLLEVFADITCPFTHVGLRRVVATIEACGRPVEVAVRAWPLEWVNGSPLEAEAVAMKADVLRTQLGVDAFTDVRTETWPSTTIPALNLAAAANAVSSRVGLRVNLALRDALFEDGRDITDPSLLADIAAAHDLAPPPTEPSPAVEADYAEGQRRGVRGSPDFWIGNDEFFCPALRIGHDDTGLVTEFDAEGFDAFLRRLDA